MIGKLLKKATIKAYLVEGLECEKSKFGFKIKRLSQNCI